MLHQPSSFADADTPRRFAVLGKQLPFAAVFGALIMALVLWEEGSGGLPDAAVIAFGVNFLATMLAAVVPWQLLPRWTEAVVPLLDMVAVVWVLTIGARATVLIVLPVLWLARMGRVGAVTAIVTGICASAGVDVARAVDAGVLVITPDNAARLFIIPAVIIAVALVLHVSERRSGARRDLLAGQSALVEELLEETSLDRARLEGVLNTIDAGVIVLDPAGTVAIINRAMRDATSGDIAAGTPLTDLSARLYAPDGSTPVSADRLERVARGGRVEREVVWWEHGPQDRSAYRVSAGPLPGRDGAGEGSVVALHDITDELLALAQREDFVSSVSHELRTPLTSVTGYLDLALDDPELPERVAGYLSVAERNAARLQILIDNLLTAARTRADSGSWEPVDLREVVDDVVESQTPRAEDRRITIEVTGGGSCVIRGDVGRATQVVDNVVSNAVKYSHAGGHVHVDVSGPGHGPGQRADRVCLTVTDDGPGISSEAQQQLFSRFYRAPEVRGTVVQGTGLGLHISRQIVEALGGTITLSSEPGKGTTVAVHLPVGEPT
ncbi:sensor histidine kinase [Georgenia sp. H159]|uniref:sensor histidine kinase n=1 Tax=Georgenia sp. H159 TaxID=3076115 RepID=UPI002D791849|nr:ATP-binding protein [Georgenia sp. H159]